MDVDDRNLNQIPVITSGDSKQNLQHVNTGGMKSTDLKHAFSINNSALVLSQKSQEGFP